MVLDKQRLQILRTLDKADRMEPIDLYGLFTTGRKDTSGDFTQGCGLDSSQAIFLTAFVFMEKYPLIQKRIKLMEAMDQIPGDDQPKEMFFRTLLDDFLDSEVEKRKADPTRDVAWILDDIYKEVEQAGGKFDGLIPGMQKLIDRNVA